MLENTGTREALRLMDELKVQSPGFDYWLAKDKAGKSTGIMYMTAQTRCHACWYGTVLCLDAQKRQFNSSGWPYIAPVMKDNEMKVAVAAESIVMEETHKFYIWIIQSMVDSKPCVLLSNIKIIFADQQITPTVLWDLGIEATCTLQGDFYPYSMRYGLNNFILLSTPSSEIPQCYAVIQYNRGMGKQLLLCSSLAAQSTPRSLSALNAIYNNPTKYAGFYLRSTEGNLHMNGDVSAEHS